MPYRLEPVWKNYSRNPCRKSFSSMLRSIQWRTVKIHRISNALMLLFALDYTKRYQWTVTVKQLPTKKRLRKGGSIMRKKQFLQFRRAMATLLAVAMIGQNTVIVDYQNKCQKYELNEEYVWQHGKWRETPINQGKTRFYRTRTSEAWQQYWEYEELYSQFSRARL